MAVKEGAVHDIQRLQRELLQEKKQNERLTTAIKWVLKDMSYKAPEQIDATAAARWDVKLRDALNG